MLTHEQIWGAIDALAMRTGMTPSGLAKRAGLDPTTFNRSKRKGADGNPRWPSTESIAKVLAATGVEVDDFLAPLKSDGRANLPLIPFRALDGDFAEGLDAAGLPEIAQWDRISNPAAEFEDLIAIGLTDKRFAPIYREGDILIVSPSAECRRGDRVFILGHDKSADIAVLRQNTSNALHVRALTGEETSSIKHAQIRLLARILWVSQ